MFGHLISQNVGQTELEGLFCLWFVLHLVFSLLIRQNGHKTILIFGPVPHQIGNFLLFIFFGAQVVSPYFQRLLLVSLFRKFLPYFFQLRFLNLLKLLKTLFALSHFKIVLQVLLDSGYHLFFSFALLQFQSFLNVLIEVHGIPRLP